MTEEVIRDNGYTDVFIDGKWMMSFETQLSALKMTKSDWENIICNLPINK